MIKGIRILLSMALLAVNTSPSVFPQLRNISPYTHDRINSEKTFFTLKEDGSARYAWAFEWTQQNVQAYAEKQTIFIWHFSDGSKAYSRLGEFIGDAGMITSYLPVEESSSLETAAKVKVQPMTRTNLPVKVEVWIGEAGDKDAFKPEIQIDAACRNSSAIEYGRTYHFTDCTDPAISLERR